MSELLTHMDIYWGDIWFLASLQFLSVSLACIPFSEVPIVIYRVTHLGRFLQVLHTAEGCDCSPDLKVAFWGEES